MKDVRWKQRFQNFDRAFELLRSALEARSLDEYSDLEQEGLIQRFEYSYELAWKLMKDWLEHNGVVIPAPVGARSVIKEAYAAELVSDGQVWIDMMLHRNALSHTYDFSTFEMNLTEVKGRYLSELSALHKALKARLESE
ncbi:MAG: nucleotidyltransferase substrate binding protein [Opitutales bacterium]|jgi:nucleotidyltransferase substrate binding protein (TIGR01987 family)